ncbi:hypothetical protein Dimus_022048 [Dionaea muscipula]
MANSNKSIVSNLQEDHEVLQPITHTMWNKRPATEALGLSLNKGNSVEEFRRETRGGQKVGAFAKYSHFARDCTEKNHISRSIGLALDDMCPWSRTTRQERKDAKDRQRSRVSIPTAQGTRVMKRA